MLYLAIPPNLHHGELIKAAQMGINLFVEKPMSLYLDEALKMEAAIKEACIYSAVGFQQRFEPRNEAVKEFLSDKRVWLFLITVMLVLMQVPMVIILHRSSNRMASASRMTCSIGIYTSVHFSLYM